MPEKAKSMLKKIGDHMTVIGIDEYLDRFARDKGEGNAERLMETAVAPPPPPPRRSRAAAVYGRPLLRSSTAPDTLAATTPTAPDTLAATTSTAATAAPGRAAGRAKTLLVNGGCAMYAAAVDGRRVRVINTCAFDSLATILACAYADVPAYRAYVDGSGNAMLRYCRALAESGPARGPGAAADRARVMWPALDVASLRPPRAAGRPAVLDGKCNVAHVVTRLLGDAPSAVERVRPCPTAGCGPAPPSLRRSSRLAALGPPARPSSRPSSRPPSRPPPPPPPPRHLPSATVVLDWPADGPRQLQAAVDEYADERLVVCGSCSRPSVSRSRALSAHLLIEADAYGSPVCAALLPAELSRDGQRYTLYGIIHYGEHHYKSVIRKSECWEIHNDLRNFISTTTKIGYLVPHLIVYIRI